LLSDRDLSLSGSLFIGPADCLCSAHNDDLSILGMVAETERKFIRERQQAGIETAKAKGIYRGRKPFIPVGRVREMRDAGHGPTAIAKALGISRMRVHRTLAEA
jgi:DNA invertase Pin-like site-specific DNA recombinase